MIRRPSSVMAAQYSLPYIVGATLTEGPQAFDAYGEDHHDDSNILRLADLVEAKHDADIEAAFPKHMGSGVDVVMKDGSSRSETLHGQCRHACAPHEQAAGHGQGGRAGCCKAHPVSMPAQQWL